MKRARAETRGEVFGLTRTTRSLRRRLDDISIPTELFIAHFMPYLGAQGDYDSFLALQRLARTCKTLYFDSKWQRLVKSLHGEFTSKLTEEGFSPFQDTIESISYYQPRPDVGMGLTNAFDQCKKLQELKIIRGSLPSLRPTYDFFRHPFPDDILEKVTIFFCDINNTPYWDEPQKPYHQCSRCGGRHEGWY
jgi:hypothetical protein